MRCSKTDYDARSVNAVLGVFLTVEIPNYDGFVDCYAIPHLCTHKCEIWHETMNAKLESLLST